MSDTGERVSERMHGILGSITTDSTTQCTRVKTVISLPARHQQDLKHIPVYPRLHGVWTRASPFLAEMYHRVLKSSIWKEAAKCHRNVK